MNATNREDIHSFLKHMLDKPFDGGPMGLIYGLCIAAEYALNHDVEYRPVVPWDEIHTEVRKWCRDNELTDEFSR